MALCVSCGRESEGSSTVCSHCGAPLAQTEPSREQRKAVTILFCDLVHSTGLAEGDPEAYRRIQSRFFDTMSQIVERHGGTVEKFIGDEVMAVFGVPTAHEDDVLRAVRSAEDMREALIGLGHEFRMGINTGEVLVAEPEHGYGFVAGEPVIIAKRLAQAAEPGEILIGKATYPLVAHAVSAGPLERIPVKGKRDEVGRRRLEEVDREAPAVARRLQAPIVGRNDELGLLTQAFERAVEESSCRLFTVLGPAGIGKSRLVGELCASLGERATTATGRCVSYGEGITFWPLAEALRALDVELSLDEALTDDTESSTILELLRGLMGTADEGSSEETFWAVRRAFEAIARRRPAVVCFEDLHWAEPTMLDLVEYVVGWSRGAPILIVALARPELIEARPQWVAPEANHDALVLEPLSSADTESLLEDLSAEAPLPAEVRKRIAEAAEGNPLFVEQMSAMVAEDGGELATPPSIQALLAERLDRLSDEERDVLARASVVGRDFAFGILAGLFPQEQRALLTPGLLTLVRKGLIRAEQSASAGEDRFSFEHVLVRDAAYDAMPKELRAALHEQVARLIRDSDSELDAAGLAGYHLEQAFRYRREVGLVDDHTQRLRIRAAELLAPSGSRALIRNDAHAALKLLRRATELRPDDPAVDVRLDLAQALMLSGELGGALDLIAETEARAKAAGDRAGELRARLLRGRIAAHVQSAGPDSEEPSAELLALSEEARPVFAQAGDDVALAEAWAATAYAYLIRCRMVELLEAVDHACEHARRAGLTRWDGELPILRATGLFYGPTPVAEALRWYEEEEAAHPVALTQQAMLEAMRGNFERARELAGSADTAAEEFGQKLWLAVGGMALWEIETLAGDVSAAESAVRRSCEVLEEVGEAGYRYNAVGQLAASLYALDRLEEAEELTLEAEQHAPADDVASQMLWRRVRARVLARRGEHAQADQLGCEAVALAERTDMLNWQADAFADLAEVHFLAGRADDAEEQQEQALALFERKGNVVAAAQARGRLEERRAGVIAPQT